MLTCVCCHMFDGGAFGGPDIAGLVEQWRPEKWYRSEKKFEDDLAGYLRENTGRGTTVRTQSRNNNIDIRVGDAVGIELKRKLTPSKVDRLIGQLDRYDFPTVIIAVCGSSDNAWEDLRERTRRGPGMGFGQQQEVIPIRKEKNDRATGRDDGQDPFGLGGDSLF